MASEPVWPTRPLKDCAFWYSGGTPNRGTPSYWGGAIPWISAKSLNNFFVTDSEDRVTEEGARNGTRIVPKDSILLVVRGMSLKSEFRMGITTQPVTFNQDLKALVAVGDVVPEYLAYAIRSRTSEILQMVGEAGHGTGVLPTDRIQALEIPIPSVQEQRAIAQVLGTLDDKIELNRRTNETLEAIVRAMFKSWFVDFDPVRAKASGEPHESICRHRRLTPDLLALFPDRLVDSELGEIPEGWEISNLGDLLDVLETGRRPKGGVASFVDGVPSVGAENILGLGKYDYSKTKYVPEDFFAAMNSGHVEPWDVLLYKDGGKPGDFKPRVSMFAEGFPYQRFAINEHVYRLRSDALGQTLLFFQIEQERVLADLRQRGAKAAIPGINQTDVKTLKLIVPVAPLVKEFDALFSPLSAAILRRANESQALATVRDALLPKLLSGELRVPLDGAA